MPGSSTINDAMITVLRLSGAMNVATAMATKPASIAAIASPASFSRGRLRDARSSRPISNPVQPAVAMSSHGSRSKPATAAAARPKPNTCSALPRQRSGRSSARSAAWPSASPSVPAMTSSAMRSASHSLYRSVSPGAQADHARRVAVAGRPFGIAERQDHAGRVRPRLRIPGAASARPPSARLRGAARWCRSCAGVRPVPA